MAAARFNADAARCVRWLPHRSRAMKPRRAALRRNLTSLISWTVYPHMSGDPAQGSRARHAPSRWDFVTSWRTPPAENVV